MYFPLRYEKCIRNIWKKVTGYNFQYMHSVAIGKSKIGYNKARHDESKKNAWIKLLIDQQMVKTRNRNRCKHFKVLSQYKARNTSRLLIIVVSNVTCKTITFVWHFCSMFQYRTTSKNIFSARVIFFAPLFLSDLLFLTLKSILHTTTALEMEHISHSDDWFYLEKGFLEFVWRCKFLRNKNIDIQCVSLKQPKHERAVNVCLPISEFSATAKAL